MTLFSGFAAAIMVIAAPIQAQERLEIPLRIESLPDDLWAKNRITPELVEGGLRMYDTGDGAFNDASFWQIDLGQDLPYGRKMLSFDVAIDPQHQPLWGRHLIQPIIDGQEATPALNDDGTPSYDLSIAGDGKGFIIIPEDYGVQTITLDIPTSQTRLSTFAFMTGGATGFDMTLTDIKVVAWPEDDTRVFPQNPVTSSLGFPPGHPQSVIVEWSGFEPGDPDAPTTADLTLTGPMGAQDITVALPRRVSAASASAVSRLSFDLDPGAYTLTLPAVGERSAPAEVAFTVQSDRSALTQMRDEAWGVFYWITSGPTGPFPDAHPQDTAARIFGGDATRDITGGWYDAGDYGKYSVNGAWAASLMLLTGLNAPEVLNHDIAPLAGGTDRPDWIDVVTAQLDWLVKMQSPDGGVNHKVTTRNWPGLDVRPEEDTAVKYLMPVSSTATADYAATLALGAKILQHYDADRAALFEAAAARALAWLDANPNLVMIETTYDGAQYGGPYTDDDDTDERFFARAAWAALQQTPEAIAAVEADLETRRAVLYASDNDTYWGKVDLLGMWALKSIEDQLSENGAAQVNGALRSAAHKWSVLQQRSQWLLPMEDTDGFPWGSNGGLATTGWHWAMWARVDGDDKYTQAAQVLLPYFHGRNPLGQTYVTNDVGVRNPHLRPHVSGAFDLPPGFISGGANSIDLAGDPTSGAILGQPPLRMFVDHKDSYATNEVAINWQAAWSLYASLLVAAP
ncbi:glycoside hydrolase family 9 protein [Pseudooctadecabacter jejudonensis]|nr:glycoside hydrolase family 9 protein [Pseudooctadecabacter jejudonensis]